MTGIPHGSIDYLVQPGGRLSGRVRVPGDKSISHRSVLLAAVARGTTTVTGFLEAADTLATVEAVRTLGVDVEGPEEGRVIVRGVGRDGLRRRAGDIDLGNSGTGMRLLAGLVAGHGTGARLLGDDSLMRRPMRRITEPLRRMGAAVRASEAGTPPLAFSSRGTRLRPIDYEMPVASAQIKSCLLIAGLYADGLTCVREPGPSRDHTERMLETFGQPVGRSDRKVWVRGPAELIAAPVEVPSDLSSAAFFIVGCLIAENSEIVVEGVGVNPTRAGVIDILRRMGGDIELFNERRAGAEPVADIRVRSSALRGINIGSELVPLAIDEFPAIFVAAAAATGETSLAGARELRVKESDRIAAMAEGLTALGVEATPAEDGIRIVGTGGTGGTGRKRGQRGRGTGRVTGGRVESRGDHRVAMALTMAALGAEAPVIVSDCANVATSFPGFPALARDLGMQVEVSAAVGHE